MAGKATLRNIGFAANTYTVRFSVIRSADSEVLGMNEDDFTAEPGASVDVAFPDITTSRASGIDACARHRETCGVIEAKSAVLRAPVRSAIYRVGDPVPGSARRMACSTSSLRSPVGSEPSPPRSITACLSSRHCWTSTRVSLIQR